MLTLRTVFYWIAISLIIWVFVIWGAHNVGEQKGDKTGYEKGYHAGLLAGADTRGEQVPIVIRVTTCGENLPFVIMDPLLITAFEIRNDSLHVELVETKLALKRCRSGYKAVLGMEE